MEWTGLDWMQDGFVIGLGSNYVLVLFDGILLFDLAWVVSILGEVRALYAFPCFAIDIKLFYVVFRASGTSGPPS